MCEGGKIVLKKRSYKNLQMTLKWLQTFRGIWHPNEIRKFLKSYISKEVIKSGSDSFHSKAIKTGNKLGRGKESDSR